MKKLTLCGMTGPDRIYVTFGQAHRHMIRGIVFDKDCVALVTTSREDIELAFGKKHSIVYTGMSQLKIECYPRGVIELPKWFAGIDVDDKCGFKGCQGTIWFPGVPDIRECYCSDDTNCHFCESSIRLTCDKCGRWV